MAGLPIGPSEAEILLRPRRPIATLTIIAINVVLYLMSSANNMFMRISNDWLYNGGYIPISLAIDPNNVYRLISSMFLHADIFHIFFNMYFLYIFGKAVENVLGPRRFLILYFLSGLAASVFHTAFSALQGYDTLSIPAIGASGAISGVLGAYLVLFPGTSITSCWFFYWYPICFTLRAAAYLIFWFALQIIYGYLGTLRIGAGVAFFAHAGGFIAGIALLPFLIERSKIEVFRMRRSFIESIFSFIKPFRRTQGLGKGAKIALLILIGAVFVGGIYTYLTADTIPQTVYDLKGSVVVYTLPLGVVLYNRSFVYYLPIDFETPQTMMIVDDDVRILMNRFLCADLLVNKEMRNRIIVDKIFKTYCTIAGVEVPIELRIDRAEYDSSGVLKYFRGVVKTYAVLIRGHIGIGVESTKPRLYSVELKLSISSVREEIALTSLISIVTSLVAIYTIVYRDRDLALIGEEPEYTYGTYYL